MGIGSARARRILIACALGFAHLAHGQVHPDYTGPLPGPNDDLTGTEFGRALIFADGVFDFDAMRAAGDMSTPIYKPLTEVLLTNLGMYDENGARTGDGGGVLNGKYGHTRLQKFNFALPPISGRISAANQDFRVNPFGDATTTARDAILWSSEAHFYYFVNEYRVKYLNDSFIDSLNLPSALAHNVKHLQYRPDLNLVGTTPGFREIVELVVNDRIDPEGLRLFPVENSYQVYVRTRAPIEVSTNGELGSNLPPISHAFDRSAVIWDYAGLAAFWVVGTNTGFPGEFGFGTSNSWVTDVRGCINDSLSMWVAYRVSGQQHFNKDWHYNLRHWSGRPYGDTTVTGPASIPWDQGTTIRNVMMFDQQNLSRDGVFPYRAPGGSEYFDGPQGSDLAAFFVGAVFYDIANEAGLGVNKADQLF